MFGWSVTTDNPVGAEYIIMEAIGRQLGELWDQMSPNEKLGTMKEIVSIETKMLSVSFSQYVFIFSSTAHERSLIQPSATGPYILRVIK